MRGLGQIAWLASFATARHRRDHERRPRPPRARRDGRERRAREGRADRGAAARRHRGRARRAAARAVPRTRRTSGSSSASSGDEPLPFATSYTSRHQLANTGSPRCGCDGARHPAAGRRARGRVLAAARGGDRAPGRRSAAERLLQREPGLDARGARAPRRAREPDAGASPCSARWPSSARERRPTTTRSAQLVRELGIERVARASGELARAYGGEWVATAAEAADALARAAASRRRRARQGLALGGTRGGRGETDQLMARVLVAALVALIISILGGPTFIDFLRRNELGQHIREEGPQHHLAKQGTPTMGGAPDRARGDDRVPAALRLHAAGADDLRDDARLRRDRLPRRLDQAAPPAARSACAAAGRCCCCSAITAAVCVAAHHQQLGARRLRPDRRLLDPARLGLVRARVPHHRRRRERGEPDRRPRRPRRRARRSSRSSR